ncbi:Poly(U)-binding-splicing factor puf60 [Borealophlyctis nickersoniae]|nr:Poly(U)-binding-splicing factor puf60 [Borealophlyctis nickersoniae]
MFAREQTAKLMAAKLGTAAPALLTPGAVAAGLEARSLAVMSRIYVGSINFELTEVHIKQVFGQFGYVKAISMTIDPLTQKHKGFCFVEYEVPEAAQLALDNMNGAQLGGRQLKVGRPNNFNSNAATFPSAPPTRLYIANVNEFVTEDNIASIFEAFGNIKGCVLMPDPLTRKHKTAGYVEFEEESGADGAIRAMNGFELGGMHLRVMKAIVGGPLPEGMKSLEKMAPGAPIAAIPAKALNTAMSINNTIARKIGTTPSIASSLPISAMLAKAQEKANEETTSLEDNVSISASQRYSIMQKLLRSKEQSPVIALKNMIKLKESHDQELYEEIADECRKFGDVVKIGTDGSGAEDPEEHVVLFVQFGSAEAAERAKMGLHGRFFGGQLVEASFSSLEEFRKKF